MRISSRDEKLLDRILAEIGELADQAIDEAQAALRVDAVSHWSVAKHLEHLASSDSQILDGLEALLAGKICEISGGPSLVGRWVLLTGIIPRGRAKAPGPVVPVGIETEAIRANLATVRERFERLRQRLAELSAAKAKVAHPILGRLTAKQWLRFVSVHHRHHAAIMLDIRAAAPDRA